MRALAVMAGVCAVLAVAGCGKSTQSGTPTAAAQTTLTKDQLWDPCSLPDDAVAATGVKADSKNANPFGTARSGWKGCSWTNDAYSLAVFSTTRSMAEVRSNSSFQNLHDIDVPGRKAVSYQEASNSCGVDFPTTKGVVEVLINQSATSSITSDYCAIAVHTVDSLNSLIPK